MRRFLTLILPLFFLFSSRLFATHIVGGEFELIHVSGYTYNLKLNQYFDHIHGNPGAEDQYVLAIIYSKKDDSFISYAQLVNVHSEFVPYTNPLCNNNSINLQTRKIVYETEIYLYANIYNDPEGYYIVWERCCRNGIITNIREPENSGMTFYLEFPPVVKNNKPFINSSPILFPPLSDYAVVNQLYYVDFGGVDPDGDSLVYTLEVPLRGNSSPEEPVVNGIPAPYRKISWQFGYNIANVIPGPVPLNIDKKGNITVVPGRPGLYVFSVKCEEFRENVKIGEVIRDFQLLVVELDVGQKPKIQAANPAKNTLYSDGEILKFGIDDLKCFELRITDPDRNERIKVKAVPVNFSADLSQIFSETNGIIKDINDTLKITVCLPNCSYTQDEPFFIDFIAMDDACSLPLMDTVRLGFLIEPKENQNPIFIKPIQETIRAEVISGETFELELSGIDYDGDLMKMTMQPQGFEMQNYGMTFQEIYSHPGDINAIFNFNPDCNYIDFSSRSKFILYILLQDLTECNESGADLLKLELNVKFPEENPPEISTDLEDLTITTLPGEVVTFNVFGKDLDNDIINLVGFGADFDFKEHNMHFEDKTGRGTLSSLFSWSTECSNLRKKDEYLLNFVVDDRGACKLSNYDTLKVRIKIMVPENEAPIAAIDDISVPVFQATAGEKLKFTVIGFDTDKDSIELRMVRHPQAEYLEYQFEPVRGKGRVNSLFQWTPECSLFREGSNDVSYNFKFVVTDLKCLNSKSDTISVTVNVENLLFTLDEFIPYNVFTPNDDQVNDFFEIDNLPPDNCENQFLGISIFNRWGKLVFEDTRRDFRWDGNGFSTGVYYYLLKYSNYDYKGTVSILY